MRVWGAARAVKQALYDLADTDAFNHLVDAVDRRVITETIRQEHDLKIQGVLRGLTPLISYLQSPQARTNVERIKRKRAQRRKRKGGNDEPGTQNS
jgi:hypothetical protein